MAQLNMFCWANSSLTVSTAFSLKFELKFSFLCCLFIVLFVMA